ncbi:MAG: hypothetical protein AB7T49_00925 [Oligoflexales bacterium]
MKLQLLTSVMAALISASALAERIEPTMIECQGTTSDFTIRYTTSSKVGKPTLYTDEAGAQMFTMDVKTVAIPHGVLAYNTSTTESRFAPVFSLIVPPISLPSDTEAVEFETLASKTIPADLESQVAQHSEFIPVRCQATLAFF